MAATQPLSSFSPRRLGAAIGTTTLTTRSGGSRPCTTLGGEGNCMSSATWRGPHRTLKSRASPLQARGAASTIGSPQTMPARGRSDRDSLRSSGMSGATRGADEVARGAQSSK
eukprot:scaffold164026_cov31-Tisochrysis_lutea.AAC.2